MVSSYLSSSKLTIDLDIIQKNYQLLQEEVFPATAMCVVKANAYGLGAVEVTKALLAVGAKIFFVATLQEALILKKHIHQNFSLYVLEGFCKKTLPIMLEKNISPVINTLNQLKILKEETFTKKIPIKAMLHYDTGMSRLGLSDEDIAFLDQHKEYLDGISIQYIISHLACASTNHPFNDHQGKKMMELQKKWPNFKYSLLASKGLWLKNKYKFDGVRLGMSLYAPSNPTDTKKRQALMLESQVLQVRSVPPNVTIGYDATFTTSKKTTLAILGIGFADGYMRSCSNATQVAFHGELFPVVGRISMDLCTIDVTSMDKKNIKEGDWVEIVGPNISLYRFPVSPYEFLSRLSTRAERIYKINTGKKIIDNPSEDKE